MEQPARVVAALPATLAPSGSVELSPFDLANQGRAIPMVWFYRESLDPATLLAALRETLKSYPVLCGRYGTPPNRLELSNQGVPVDVVHQDTGLNEAVSHLRSGQPTIFAADAHLPFVPDKSAMEPDTGSADAPLLAIKITIFPEAAPYGSPAARRPPAGSPAARRANGSRANLHAPSDMTARDEGGGGTAIGVLVQHGVLDVDAMVSFVTNWSRLFRGLSLDPKPDHKRLSVVKLPLINKLPLEGERLDGFKMRVLQPGENLVPEFLPVMHAISGGRACVVPFDAATLQQLKAAAMLEVPAGAFVSTDDVLTARAWRALCAVRCGQLGIALDSDEVTTCSRASNFRQVSKLGPGYCANGVSQVWTELPVRELLKMSVAEVALRLRADLQAHTAAAVVERAHWLLHQQRAGRKAVQAFDAHALTFVLSSWGFDWEAADFGAVPFCCDQGAHMPIVATLLPRPGGDGVHLYASGTQEGLEHFVRLVAQKLMPPLFNMAALF